MDKIRQTFKSGDTEEWLDKVWTRPIGYCLAVAFARLGIHPNAVTVASMAIGAGSALFFAHGSHAYEGMEGLLFNLTAIAMLALVLVSGFGCHSGQCGIADYYRQIHLFFPERRGGQRAGQCGSTEGPLRLHAMEGQHRMEGFPIHIHRLYAQAGEADAMVPEDDAGKGHTARKGRAGEDMPDEGGV